MTSKSSRFGLDGLYRAVDRERLDRDLSWAALAREVGVAASTIRRFECADDAEADGVLALVRWLGVPPEEFVADTSVVGEQLLPPGKGYVRTDMFLVEAADYQREMRGRARTSIQRLVAVAQTSGRTVASLTRWSEV